MSDVGDFGRKVVGQFMGGASEGGPGAFGVGRYRQRPDEAYTKATKDAIGAMRKRMEGRSPSFAEMATQDALRKNMQQQQAGIKSIGGISGALKQKLMAEQAGRAGQEIAAQGGMLRAKEQAQAESALAQAGLGGQEADIARNKINLQAFEGAGERRQQGIKALGEGFAGGMKGMGKWK